MPGCDLADLLFIERRLSGEIEALEVADKREARRPDAHLDAALVPRFREGRLLRAISRSQNSDSALRMVNSR